MALENPPAIGPDMIPEEVLIAPLHPATPHQHPYAPPKRQEGCKEEDGLDKEPYEWQVEEAINTL